MKVKVGIFINQTPGSAFFRVFHHAELARRYEREFEFPKGSSDEDILNQVWRIFNADRPADYTGSSLSMADVVTLNDDRSYEVLAFGFGRLPVVAKGEQFRVELPKPKLSEIKEWRTTEQRAGRCHSWEAFHQAHNICPRCRGQNHLAGYPENSCEHCGGTGEYPATTEDRVRQGLRNMAASIREGAQA